MPVAIQDCTALTEQQGSTDPSTDALRTVLLSRRHRKTLSNGEDVWPEHLEAALLEGLEKYIPDDSPESRMLGRYSRFVNNIRVSRLHTAVHQPYTVLARITATEAIWHGWPTSRRLHFCQNVHSCGSAKSSMALQRQTPFGSGSEGSGDRASKSGVGSSSSKFVSKTQRVIRRLLDPSSFRQPVSRESFNHMLNVNSESTSTSAWNFARSINISLPRPPIYSPLHLSYQLQLHGVDSVHIQANCQVESSAPLVTFISASPIYAVSSFTVYFDGRAVHTEGVTMTTRSGAVQGMSFQQFQLSAALVPAYWKTITDSTDPGKFSILQEVAQPSQSNRLFTLHFSFTFDILFVTLYKAKQGDSRTKVEKACQFTRLHTIF
ncbi:hypothetical protein GGX14DRAFT_405691 [Mycena pura]|uniref:TEA domain-containing protein n=1 Tax=Mycena pura TaxID=153505 RepID=A0AAD6UVH8_9AGAR|nr:hypothetical protein GGX14DRAFT_405691 [Mycena pura]